MCQTEQWDIYRKDPTYIRRIPRRMQVPSIVQQEFAPAQVGWLATLMPNHMPRSVLPDEYTLNRAFNLTEGLMLASGSWPVGPGKDLASRAIPSSRRW